MRIEFLPDWSVTWTASEAEEQLHEFKFRGPGWYTCDARSSEFAQTKPPETSTMLVIPDSEVEYGPEASTAWRQTWPADQKFRFYMYAVNPATSFNAIANAPSRS